MRWIDPVPSLRALRQPLPDDHARPLARSVRLLGWIIVGAASLSVGTLLLVGAGWVVIAIVFNETFPILGALFSMVLYQGLLMLATGVVLIAGITSLLLRPVGAMYSRVLRGEPLPRWSTRGGGIALLLAGFAFPITFLVVFFATTTAEILIGTFIGTLLSPMLFRAGWGLLRAGPPLVV